MTSEPANGRCGKGEALDRKRCSCVGCGAQTVTSVGMVVVAGSCSVCGSWELVPMGGEVGAERAADFV